MNLRWRLATSFILICLISVVIFLFPPIFLGIGTAFFCARCLYEYMNMLRHRGVFVYRWYGVTIGAIIPLLVYFQERSIPFYEILIIILACFALFIMYFNHPDSKHALDGIALTFFGILYISWFMSFVLRIRFLDGGPMWIAYILVVTKISDVGAYLIGTRFGRTPLLKHVSPKKSLEGTIAGLLFSAMASCAMGPFLPIEFGYAHLFLMGVLISVVGQLGDLAESLIKRYCGMKDASQRLPGFGGLLDVVDSVLFTLPLFYFYLRYSFS